MLQNKGLRCALKRDLGTASADLHVEARLLKLKFRREQHILNYMYDTAQLGSNLKSLPNTNVRTRSQNKKMLRIKRPCTEKFLKSLAYAGPSKWNQLPTEAQHSQSKNSFKLFVSKWIEDKGLADLASKPVY